MNDFPTSYDEIIKKVEAIDPVVYARTRNFLDGKVTGLSPYISRGVISTHYVKRYLLSRGYSYVEIEKLIQELAWRDYFYWVWSTRKESMFADMRQTQQPVVHYKMVKALEEARTGIHAIDRAIREFYQTGYMHNHLRMYVASIACNFANAHWSGPAKWLYYHLLDGDLASNTCSWQWVAGCFSSKKYIANQDNVNKYTGYQQRGTFMDREYDRLLNQPIPENLQETSDPVYYTQMPAFEAFEPDPSLPLFLYHSYHLDPKWRETENANRVLVLEPSHFYRFPVSEKVMDFILRLAGNIPGIRVYCGEVADLTAKFEGKIYTIDHPVASHYPGHKDPLPAMFPNINGYYNGFFAYWKKCQKYLLKEIGDNYAIL
jgi:deoxyribodipyrimidine photo-lyase